MAPAKPSLDPATPAHSAQCDDTGVIFLPPVRLDYSEAPHCSVGLSLIHGDGLFATQPLPKGAVVANYAHTLRRWTEIPYARLPAAVKELCWFVGLSETTCRIGAQDSVFMRANHSRTPNCLWLPRAFKLIALRPISAGEEVTYDYRLEIAPAEDKAHPPSWA